jgi:hypothetical protein
MNNLDKLLKGEHILGLINVHFEKNRICSACQAGKQVGAPHPAKNVLTTTRPLELLHMDIFGPVAYVSIGGNKYGFVIFLKTNVGQSPPATNILIKREEHQLTKEPQ